MHIKVFHGYHTIIKSHHFTSTDNPAFYLKFNISTFNAAYNCLLLPEFPISLYQTKHFSIYFEHLMPHLFAHIPSCSFVICLNTPQRCNAGGRYDQSHLLLTLTVDTYEAVLYAWI